MPSGTVKFYNKKKGYGFIQQDDGGDDVYFHATALAKDADLPSNGQRVSFTVGTNPRDGRPRAERVKVIA